jgi:hypothetical protein
MEAIQREQAKDNQGKNQSIACGIYRRHKQHNGRRAQRGDALI